MCTGVASAALPAVTGRRSVALSQTVHAGRAAETRRLIGLSHVRVEGARRTRELVGACRAVRAVVAGVTGFVDELR